MDLAARRVPAIAGRDQTGNTTMDPPGRSGAMVLVAMILVALVLAAAAACTGQSPPSTPNPPSTPSTTSTLTAEEQAAEPEIRRAYLGFVDAVAEANRRADPEYPGLKTYLSDLLLPLYQRTIRENAEHEAAYVGEVTVTDVTMTSIDLGASRPTATVTACRDATAFQLVFRDSRSPVPGARPGGRFVQTATVTFYQLTDGDRWVVDASDIQEDKPC